MIYHVLPGDAQVDTFRQTGIGGEILVCRECLVEGDLTGETLDEFFINRAAFINEAYDEDPSNYDAGVASQFRRLTELNHRDEVNLWFEYELFCSANLWFSLALLSRSDAAVYRVEPTHLNDEDRWDGFANVSVDDMRVCFDSRTKLSGDDISLGHDLWNAFRDQDNGELRRLASTTSPAFPYLKEVCDAAAERNTKPAAIVAGIRNEGITEFDELFREFRERAGIYGYGDSQVKRILQTR